MSGDGSELSHDIIFGYFKNQRKKKKIRPNQLPLLLRHVEASYFDLLPVNLD